MSPTLLLLLYASAVCRPVLPLAADAMGHLFWRQHHLHTVHAHHGHQHLHDELKQAMGNSQPDATGAPAPDSTNKKNSDFLSVHFAGSVSALHFLTEKKDRSTKRVVPVALPEVFIEITAPPPDLIG